MGGEYVSARLFSRVLWSYTGVVQSVYAARCKNRQKYLHANCAASRLKATSRGRGTGGWLPFPIRPLRFLPAASLPPALPPSPPFLLLRTPRRIPRTAGQLLLVVHPLLQHYDLLSCRVCAVLCIYAGEFVHVRRVIVRMLSLALTCTYV